MEIVDSSESREAPLWWRPEFLKAQEAPIVSFTHGRVLIPFVQAEDMVKIGLIGPYSGAYASGIGQTEKETLAAWENFSSGGDLPIVVRLPPDSHFPEVLRHNTAALKQLGAVPRMDETNHTIHLEENFLFRRNRQRHLREASNLGLRVAEARIPEAFNVLRANRSAKNYAMSLSAEQLERLDSQLPGSIECLTVVEKGRNIAASITFLVSREIDYVFMWGGDPRADNGSEALTLLPSEIIRKSRVRGRLTLCLGT